MDSLIDIRKHISDLIKTSAAARSAIITEVVNTGDILMSDFQFMINNDSAIENVDPAVIYRMYEALYKNGLVRDSANNIFPVSIQLSGEIGKRHDQVRFPLKLQVLKKMSDKEEYLLCLPITFVLQMREAGLLQIRSDMQRESELSVYDGKIVSHVKYSDKAARQIGEKIANNQYWSNMCRWHLVYDDHTDYSFNPNKNEIIIRSGVIAIIDGQHRSVGIEYALAKNPAANMFLPIMLTVGDPRTAQNIIAQEETRQPIEKTHILQYENTVASNVGNYLFLNSDINSIYRFVETETQEKTGLGFVIKNDLIKAIQKEYKTDIEKSQSKMLQIKMQRWLVDFLVELAINLEDDFCNYKQRRNTRWSVRSEAIYLYVHMAHELDGMPDWKKILMDIIHKIDFNINPGASIRSSVKAAIGVVDECITGL